MTNTNYEPRCGVKTTVGGYQCAKRAGHDGFHETSGGYQWRRSIDAVNDTAAAEARRLLAQPKPAVQREPLRWGRERWHYAGRVTLAGAGDRYRWELRDGDHVLDTEYRAVSSLVRPVVRAVEAREGE